MPYPEQIIIAISTGMEKGTGMVLFFLIPVLVFHFLFQSKKNLLVKIQ